MIYAFRVNSSFRAEVAMDLRKQEIVRDLVVLAEELDLGEKDCAVELGCRIGRMALARLVAAFA